MLETISLKPDQTIVFIGDSITDAGRSDYAYKPLGYGYVHFVANWLLAKYPEFGLKIINTGIGGNTIRNLNRRWKRDCLDYKPDILSVMIGINDVWRQHTNRLDEAVLHEEYELTYKQLLSQVREKKDCQLVLMEPFMFCNDTENAVYVTLQEYIRTVNNFAKEFEAVLVPLQKLIDKKIKQVSPEKWSDDMVHPFMWAHAWIAQRWLECTNLLA
jgi:acyl-CoA thioesterase-1